MIAYRRLVPSEPAPGLDPKRLDRAFETAARHVASGRTTYAALAVGRSNGLVRSAAYLGDGEVDPPPRTAIASITKPITATAILQLVEAGLVVLTEPVETYIPEFRPHPPPTLASEPEPITPWHVLTHTSGLADAPLEFFSTTRATHAGVVERLCGDRLRFAPGTAYAYASDSFFLLSEVIERLSGASYPTYVRDRVLQPVGMLSTTFQPAEPGRTELALEGNIGWPGVSREEFLAYYMSLPLPGAGLWSTPEDIVRFGRAMLMGGTLDGVRILGRPFVDLMTRRHTEGIPELGNAGRPNYGLGWILPGLGRGSPASRAAFGHTGATGSILVVDPKNDLVVVYLRNEWGGSSVLANEAVQAVYAALED
jgi:CubicO group peptidase (beta-lactamase class C family)